MQVGTIHEALKPLTWLIGKWTSIKANGQYPTMKPFTYTEKMEFISIGQPLLNYRSVTWLSDQTPKHCESGFLRIKPDSNNIAFMLGHNLGIATVEEGILDGTCIALKTTAIGKMSFVKDPPVTEILRLYKYCCDSEQLEMIVCMATSKTALTEHLRVQYKRSC